MRKIKKINGYLVVRFNAREINKWKDTGLGCYGVIDAERYTGCLAFDRSFMAFDCAATIEEAVEQARSLKSEIDIEEEEAQITLIKETGTITTETRIHPEELYSQMEESLKKARESSEVPDLDPVTEAYFKGGFVTALVSLGIVEEGDERFDVEMYPQKSEGLHNLPHHLIGTREVCRIGQLMEIEPIQGDCMVYKNIYHQCLNLDRQADHVTGYARTVLENELRRSYGELRLMYYTNYSVREFCRRHRAAKTDAVEQQKMKGHSPPWKWRGLDERIREPRGFSTLGASLEDRINEL